MSFTGIILPRQTIDIVATPAGILAANDQVAEIVVRSTGLYILEATASALNAQAAPRGVSIGIERQLPVPLTAFHRQHIGISTTGPGGHSLAWRMILRGQTRDGAGNVTEQWSCVARLTTGLLVGETLRVDLALTLLASIIEEPQERIHAVPLEMIHRLKIAL